MFTSVMFFYYNSLNIEIKKKTEIEEICKNPRDSAVFEASGPQDLFFSKKYFRYALWRHVCVQNFRSLSFFVRSKGGH